MAGRRTFLSLALAVIAALVSTPAPRLQADPASASRLGWVTNGMVTAGTTLGETLFVGGSFTRVAPAGSALGAIYRLATPTGAVVPGLPLTDGEVLDIEPDGTGGHYIAGRFSRVGGLVRSGLAHVLGDGSVDQAFAPLVHHTFDTGVDAGVVYSLGRGAAALYLGGTFDRVNGLDRPGVAAVDPTSGATLPFAPDAFTGASRNPVTVLATGGQVYAFGDDVGLEARLLDPVSGATLRTTQVGSAGATPIAAVVAGSRLILGGSFDRNPPGSALALAAIDSATGVIDTAWNPHVDNSTPQAEVLALAVAGATLYVGGRFETFGGQPRQHLAAVDIPSGTLLPWAPAADGPVHTIAVTAGGVLVGGDFMHVNGTRRERLAEVNAAGTLTTWQAAAYPMAVRTSSLDGGTVVIGGRMAVTGGAARAGLAAFDLATDGLLPWAPELPDAVASLAATGTTVYAGTLRPFDPQSAPEGLITALSSTTGATLPFVLPPAANLSGYRLLGAWGPHVYINGIDHGELARVDAATGAPDPGWRALTSTAHATVHDGVLYAASGIYVSATDLATGTRAPWSPLEVPQFSPGARSVTGLAVSGSTAFITADTATHGTATLALDVHSGRVVSWPFTPGTGGLWGLAAADGQILVGRRNLQLYPSGPASPAALAQGLRAVSTRGVVSGWQPAVTALPRPMFDEPAQSLFTTPADIVALGVEGVVPSAVHGVAVLPRGAATAPHGLTWSAVDNALTLRWLAPGTAPAGYVIDVASQPGATDLVSLPTGSTATTFAATAPSGTYYVRVRAQGGGTSNEVAVVLGCQAPPPPPTALTTTVSGAVVSVAWTPPAFAAPSAYVLSAGRSAGAADLGMFTLGSSQTSITGGLGPGTYFLRVRAVNACGQSPATPEVQVTVGGTGTLPPAPAAPTATVTGSTPIVTVRWNVVPGALDYLFEAGTAPGRSDIAAIPVTGTSLTATPVPWGRYYLRVRARSNAGTGPPSGDLVLRVPY